MAQMASKMSPAAATTAKQTIAFAVTVAQASARTLSISPDPRGQFATDGRIDNQRINFLVDTGASVVALNETSAARLACVRCRATTPRASPPPTAPSRPHARQDRHGRDRWPHRGDVDALVLPDEALSENLLGLSFLSKLKRFEYANGKLLLEQ